MQALIDWAIVILVIVVTLFFCYFTTGLSNVAGTIFERKSTPEQRAAREAEERGTVRGGRKQTS